MCCQELPQTNMDKIQIKEEEMRQRRKRLTIWKRPVDTMRYFGWAAGTWIKQTVHLSATHPLVTFLVLPLVGLWWLLEYIPGPYTEPIDVGEKYVKFAVWWIGLGILSSVGLGTGMHSGVLFLFPHIMKVCLAAEECGTLDYESHGDMWFRDGRDLFSCPDDDGTHQAVTYLRLFRKVFPACLLWGVGTAIGEIPPYAVSKAAKLAGEHLEELDEIDQLGQGGGNIGRWDVVTRMKVWMIQFLQRHGFLGVFLMSAWPNMAFDLCGICCGHFLMPFWTFFGATLLGKAGVKVTMQAAFFTMLFSEKHMNKVIRALAKVTPAKWGLAEGLQNALTQGKASFHSRTTQGSVAKSASKSGLVARMTVMWKVVMFSLVGLFAVSCIEQFAQKRAAELDQEEIDRLKREAGIPIVETPKRERSKSPVRLATEQWSATNSDKKQQ